MKVELEFIGSVAGGTPKIIISNRHENNDEQHLVHNGKFTITTAINFSPIDQLRIQFFDKVHTHDSEKDTFVELIKVVIDDINLQHHFYKGKYYPCYDENFYREFLPPDYYQPGSVMYHNGVFELDVKTPIWKFLMDCYNA